MTLVGQNVIDSRDIIARLEELQDELDAIEQDDDLSDDERKEAVAEWHEDNDDEYLPLVALNDECEGYGDWQYGETLIHRSYWVDYCIEMVSDTGDLPKEIPAYIEIDWSKTADNLEADYASVEFDGQEYLIRNC